MNALIQSLPAPVVVAIVGAFQLGVLALCGLYSRHVTKQLAEKAYNEASITRPGPTVYRNGPIATRDVAGEWDRRDDEQYDRAYEAGRITGRVV